MAKKKKSSGKRPAPQTAKKQTASWPWILLLVGMLCLMVALVVGSFLASNGGEPSSGASTTSNIPGVTAPPVDDSEATTMRIVKAGSAYVEKDKNSATRFSFSKGDQVKVVSIEGEWATISVDGRGYYLPSNAVRGLDDFHIVLDAGHQLREDMGKEALGPGGAETETKMGVGAVGVATGQAEYDVNLSVCLKLKEILEQRGYTVMLTRSHNAVNISYKERAQVANDLCADAYISLHCANVSDADTKGVGAIYQSEKNSYIGNMYATNKELSTAIVDAMSEATGAKKREAQETDKLSGINWCQVPLCYVEMGCLSNADEDRLLSVSEYQQKLATGIANGLDKFFAEEEK